MPDLRGLFLRGVGGNSAALGIQQGDAIRNITGSFAGRNENMSGAFCFKGNTKSFESPGASTLAFLEFDASRVVPTAEENRPVNMAVRYLIRARP